jgi:hypothetical protein
MGEVLHYYSISFTELLALPVAWFCKLHSRIASIQAREQLAWIPAISIPHMKEEGYRRVLKELSRRATNEDTKVVYPGDVADEQSIKHGWRRLRQMGIHG